MPHHIKTLSTLLFSQLSVHVTLAFLYLLTKTNTCIAT